MTNGEYIKQMTNDALACFIISLNAYHCPKFKSDKERSERCIQSKNCAECWLGWLNDEKEV